MDVRFAERRSRRSAISRYTNAYTAERNRTSVSRAESASRSVQRWLFTPDTIRVNDLMSAICAIKVSSLKVFWVFILKAAIDIILWGIILILLNNCEFFVPVIFFVGFLL